MSKRPNGNKRRSTFGRRRSRSFGALATNEICKTIDKSLPPAERLQFLVQYALETAFSKASQEITDSTDDFAVSKKIAAAQVEIESEIEAQNLYNLAVCNDKNSEAGVSDHVKLAQYNAAMAKLEEEGRQWDAAIAKEREELDKEINLKQIEFKGSVDKNKFNLFDYSNILEDISSMNSNITYQIKRLQSTQHQIQHSVNLTESSIATMRSKMESYFETSKKSPQTLIEEIFSEKSKET